LLLLPRWSLLLLLRLLLRLQSYCRASTAPRAYLLLLAPDAASVLKARLLR
jgi:hypothetical protein